MCVTYDFKPIITPYTHCVGGFIFGLEGGDKMKINRSNAIELWEEFYGDREYVEDFHGNLMYKHAYGDDNYYIVEYGERIYCGWNLHHILPKIRGGSNAKSNLICTNIITNECAADKITYWIDDSLYQVRRIFGTHEYEIVEL